MKKKIVIAIVLATILATGSAFAIQDGFGIGVLGSGGYGWGDNSGIGGALSLKLPSLPVYWGISFDAQESYAWLGVSGDFVHFVDNQWLAKDAGLFWFIRLGIYGKLYLREDWLRLDAGVRLPIGIGWQPVDFFELFFDFAPSIGAQFRFGSNYRDKFGLGGGLAGELGIRLWFK